MVNDVFVGPDPPQVQGPTVEVVEGPFQADIEIRVTHPNPYGSMIRFEEDPTDLQPLAPLAMRLHMEEEQIERSHTHEHQESDAEPGEIQALSQPREGEDRQEGEESEEPEGEPGPGRLMAGQKDQEENGRRDPDPERQPHPKTPDPQNITQATHLPVREKV
jgi:hypothetical protein